MRTVLVEESNLPMNARQIAHLDAAELAECTRVFRERRDVLDCFGYDLR